MPPHLTLAKNNKMNSQPLTNLFEFLDATGPESRHEIVLFRGQKSLDPLLPKIARHDPSINTIKLERHMLAELRRTGGSVFPHDGASDLDLLVRAQHFGMATRLLDWTSNPLIAVWFACMDCDPRRASYVFVFDPDDENPPTTNEIEDPFSTTRTSIFKPNLNNPRIIAQSGWFTLHAFSKSSKSFVPLDRNKLLMNQVSCYKISPSDRGCILDDLNHLGVNAQTVFPDASGLCKHLNWKHEIN